MDYEISSLLEVKSSLVPINDFKGPLPNKVYVKSAIRWRIGDARIHMEDEMIDFLWCSIIEGLVRFKRVGDSDEIPFPSQPLSLRFSGIGKNRVARDQVRITVGDFSVVVALALVERSRCEGGRAFLLMIRKFKSRPSFDNCLREIDEIERSGPTSS
jgi:hypothetical protein